ncbi:MAG TPA: PQQ-binding-like beta-propeller repeat protein [Vicinamibacterales bacterium]|nr:PQQ-binding-like beta-propeller repeat protein [Vicinamibacterales bacterium]
MRSLVILVLALAGPIYTHALQGPANWPGFRGAGAEGTGSGPVPVTWDIARSRNVQWRVPIAGLAISSPIVWNDRVFLTTAIPMAQPNGQNFRQRHVWKLLSLDRASGKVLWERTAHDGVPYMQRHPNGSYANSTPVTNGTVVVAVFGTELLAAFDMAGTPLWQKPFQVRSARNAFESGSSPVIVQDLVIVQDDRDRDSSIVAYRLKDGSEVWRVARNDGPSQATPAVWTRPDGRRLLVTVAERGLRAHDAATGAEVWRFGAKIAYGAATAAIANGLAVSTGGDDIHAVRLNATGVATAAWSTPGGGAYIPSPLVLGNIIYVLNDNGVLSAFDLQTGRKLTQVRTTSGEFCASPVSADGRIYVFGGDGEATILRTSPSLEVIGHASMGGPVKATPAIAGGVLYVRTATHLVALRETSR